MDTKKGNKVVIAGLIGALLGIMAYINDWLG
jgi:hypothetical protein